MGLFGKVAALGSGLKDKVVAAVEGAELGTKLGTLADKAAERASEYLAAGKEQAGKLVDAGKEHAGNFVDAAKEKMEDMDFDAMKRRETYVNKFYEYREIGTEKIAAFYRSTFEVDMTTAEMIDGIRGRPPSRPKDIDDIFEQCKREAFQRAISAFCLAPIMAGLDKKLEDRYANLSVDYTTFADKENGGVNVRDAKGYSDKKNEIAFAKEHFILLQNGYNGEEWFDPRNKGEASFLPHSSGADSGGMYDIEHIISAKEIYDDWLLRLGTNSDEIVDAINFDENLIFASRPLNQSKRADDLKEYLDKNGIRDEYDPNLLHININDKDIVVNEAEALEKLRRHTRSSIRCASKPPRKSARVVNAGA